MLRWHLGLVYVGGRGVKELRVSLRGSRWRGGCGLV